MKHVIGLADLGADSLEKVGGKACNLAIMARGGLPVPEAFVICTSAYHRFLEETGLGSKISFLVEKLDFTDREEVAAAAERIQTMISSQVTPVALKEDIDERAFMLGGLLAVRSSAVAEDMPDASFAGQQDSFLNVAAADVHMNVQRCWASYWNERAMTYRHDARVPHMEGGMAVLVQRMVDSRASGIMFTVDPVTGEDRTVIESVRGLGDRLASGEAAPDRFVVSRDGTVVVADDADGLGLSISDGEAAMLSTIGADLERLFGSPQDVEWALDAEGVKLLQSRPVTTVAEDDGILWTRAYGDEYWADATTPLFFSVMGPMLTDYVNHEGARIMGYKAIQDSPLLRLHKSHIYFNTWVLEQAFSYYPRYARSKELLNYYPASERERIAGSPSRTGMALMSQLRVAVRDPDGMLNRTDKAYKEWASRFMKQCLRFDRLDLSAMDYGQLKRVYGEIEEAAIGHYRLIRYGMVSHSIASNMIIKQWLRSWLNDESGELYSKLISGLRGNKTLETNVALSKLALRASKDRHVAAALRSMDNGEFMKALKDDPMLDNFHERLDEFLYEYGHRSHTREIVYPRWSEDPGMVLDVIRVLLESPTDLSKVEDAREKERLEAERRVFAALRGMKAGRVRAVIFEKVLRLAQTYLLFRENQRFFLDHILFRQRLILREYGERLQSDGVIDDRDDVFFLELGEVFALPGEDPRRLIAQRRRDFMRHRDILPPKFLRGRMEFDDTVTRLDDSTVIQGSAASPSVFRGRVRVVSSVHELSQVENGDVLVASNTDPGWTAVFHRLGGLVTETGGILSHGAVVSREYGIPAVTAVKGATTVLKTGQTITVDGNEGVIRLEE